MKVPIVFFLCAAAIATAKAAEPTCHFQAPIPGQCWTVAGMMNITADNGPVLSVGNDTQTLEVRGNPDMPSMLSTVFDKDLTALVFGDFEVCHLSGAAHSGEETVCIERAESLAIVPLRYMPIMRR